MAQYDVYRLRHGDSYVLDCQSDIWSHLQSRFTIPLVPADSDVRSVSRLTPTFQLRGERLMLATMLASTVRQSDLADRVGSLDSQRDRIIAAIDMLVSGY